MYETLKVKGDFSDHFATFNIGCEKHSQTVKFPDDNPIIWMPSKH